MLRRARRLHRAGIGAAALLLIGGSLAAAQQPPVGAPLRLTPQGAPPTPPPQAAPATPERAPTALPAPVMAPTQATPAAPLGIDGAPRPGPPQREARPGDSVEITPLASVDADGVGVRGAAGDPMTPELWGKTPRDIAMVLLQRLPGGIASPALRDLQRRLLLAQARPPEGNPPQGAPRLIALRIAKLLEMGDLDGAAALIKVLPADLDDEPIVRLKVEALWLADKREDGCAEVTKQLTRFTGVFWQQANVACQATSGQQGAASLSAQLLREQGFDNAGFFNLVESAAGGARNLPIDKLGPITPATVLLFRASKREPSADSLNASAPGVLRALALTETVPLPTRLAAGERAAMFGALSPEALGQLYLTLEAAPADIANAAALARNDKTARARAVLFRAVRNQTSATMRFELMRQAFDSSRAAGQYLVAAQLYRPVIEEAAPSAELAAFAGEAARALFAAGAPELAKRWYDLARSRGGLDAEATKAIAQLWVLLRIAGLDDSSFDPVRLLAWYDAQTARPPAALAERATLVYGLLGALGDRVPAGAWLPLLVNAAEAPKPVPGTATLLELGSAATDQRIGEAVALAATTLGPRDPTTAGLFACTGVTAALRGLNFTAPARRIALECALAFGA